jgi:peptidoglycan hydrolase-like protein with peptidoglycan-binding domain
MPEKLGVGAVGKEVERLQEELRQRGFEVPASEARRAFFGPGTRDAVLRCQREHGLACSGSVDAPTESVLKGERGRTDPTPDTPAAPERGAVPPPAGTTSSDLAKIVTPLACPPGVAVASAAKEISGQIVLEHGAPACKVTLRLYQRGLAGAKTLVGEVQTNELGQYKAAIGGAANVEVHALGTDGREVQLSATKFEMRPDERIDLIAPGDLQPPAAEFVRLTAAVAPLVGGTVDALKDAVERGDRKDFSYLAGATGWDAGALALASVALGLESTTKIPAAGLYAMARAGLPMDPAILSNVSQQTVRSALREASEAGIVDAASVDANVKAFGAFAADYRFNTTVAGTVSSPKQFIDKAILTEPERAAFAKVVREEPGPDLWERARAEGVSETGIRKLQLQGKLAYLTFNNAELAAYLETKVSSDPLELIALGFYDEQKWKDALHELAGTDAARRAALVPSVFHGRDLDERVGAYAAELARRVRQMDPHAVTIERVATGKIEGVEERENVVAFLKNAAGQGFRLGATPLSAFVNANASAVWSGVPADSQKPVLENVRKLSALYSLSPSDESMSALLAAGFTSATGIARYDYRAFDERVKKFLPSGPKAGEKRTSETIFWKAQQQSATVFNVFDGLKRLNRTSYAPGSTPEDARRRDDQIVKVREKLAGLFPTLETLFGSVDYCECDHCRSVLSPAAYLVDLLHFVDPDEEAWATVKGSYKARTGVDYSKRKPFDVLNDRRPDIKNIALTCANTNTALPYIDIVNEILEQLMTASTTPPEIEAYDVGESSSQDLIAEPQNIVWSAYVDPAGKKSLRDLVYPVTLPFDLPLEMVRAFLKQLELPLWRLRECVVQPTTLKPSASGRTDGWTDVWFERLQLSPGDVTALTNSGAWYALFGYPSADKALEMETTAGAAGPASTGLLNAKTLARRLGISYKELVELVRTRFINPQIESLITLNRLGIDPNTLDRYLGEGSPLPAAEKTEFEAALRAQNIQAADLRPLRSETIRRATLILRSPGVGCNFAETTLAFDQDPPNVDAAMALALLKMNALVRLHKKLGWDIHELDRAIMALMPGVASLTMATWPDALRTLLIYLVHVEQIRERLQDRVSREEILVLWSDIPTEGVSCLYDRMFLSPAVLGRDEAFKKHLGRVLDGGGPLLDHADGVRQALQLTHEDIEPILTAGGAADRVLSIRNLSVLMRHVVLAKGLDMPVADLVALLSLTQRTPLKPLSGVPVTDLTSDVPWSETLAFLREVEIVFESGADVAFVERICRHRGTVEEFTAEKDPVLIAVLGLPKEDPGIPEKQHVVLQQTLAAQLSAPEALIDVLLGTVLKDSSGKPLRETGFSDPARASEALRRLRKALDLVQSLGMTQAELEHLMRDAAALDPNDLPIAEVVVDATARALRQRLGAWLELAAARKQFGQAERLLAVLSAARQPIDGANTLAAREKTLLTALTALTGRKSAWLTPALQAIGATPAAGTGFEVPALADPARVRRTIDGLKCLIRLGLQPSDVVQFATATVDDVVARKVRASVKGRYTASAWRRLVKPVFDSLRKKQRDALVAHLTHVVEGDRPKYGETAEKLFEYLLIDPGMEPVVVASRIQLAIASVQLFVQRCLMNLEPEGVDPQIIDTERYGWMRRYRVWEVNRKMFVWPENWLDSEFRDDKTHIFRDLEGSLLEGDVDDDLVRNALYSYLKGLEEIARLQMLTMYFEPGVSADGSIVHVVGRTPSAPYKYFYRRVSHGMWTPWEPIDVGVEGDHLVLTAWRGRMHLFWVSFLEQAQQSATIPDKIKPGTDEVSLAALHGTTNVKLQLHWVEQVHGKWANRSSTPGFVDTAFAGKKATSDAEKRSFFVRAILVEHGAGAADDDLEIHVTGGGKAHRFVFFSKLAPPRSEMSGTAAPAPPFVNSAAGVALDGVGTKWSGSGALQAKFASAITQNSQTGTTQSGPGSHKILGGGGGYTLLFPSNESLPVPARTAPSGVGRPTGFVFGAQNAHHVAYRSSDGSIYDLFWTKNGWFYQSPSLEADGADPGDQPEPAASDPHGYTIEDRGMICLAYLGATKVHELVWSQLDPTMNDPVYLASGWHIETLYQGAADADRPEGRPFGGAFVPGRGVVFRTTDGRLLASINTSEDATWAVKELNAGLPRASSDPCGLLMTKTELAVTTVVSRHIFYIGTDGDVHELRSDVAAQSWTHTNITQAMPGVVKPAAGATPSAYAFLGQNTLHVVYRGSDDRIHELWGPPGSWYYSPIGTSFTKAKGDPAGYVTESFSTQHVVYRGENEQVVELWWNGIWRENVLSKTTAQASEARSDVAGYSFESDRTQHVVYFAPDGSLRELCWKPGGWHAGTYAIQNPFPDALGPLASPFFYEASARDHTFFVEPSVVETAVHEWTEWIVTTEQYVVPQIERIPIIPLNPDLISVVPNGVSIIKVPGVFKKKLFDERVTVRTPKGVFGPKTDPRPQIVDEGLAVEKTAPLVADLGRTGRERVSTAAIKINRGGLR